MKILVQIQSAGLNLVPDSMTKQQVKWATIYYDPNYKGEFHLSDDGRLFRVELGRLFPAKPAKSEISDLVNAIPNEIRAKESNDKYAVLYADEFIKWIEGFDGGKFNDGGLLDWFIRRKARRAKGRSRQPSI